MRGCRKVKLQADQILLSISIPFTAKHEYIAEYKQSHKRDDFLAVGNVAFRVCLEPVQGVGPCTCKLAHLVLYLQPNCCHQLMLQSISAQPSKRQPAASFLPWCAHAYELVHNCVHAAWSPEASTEAGRQLGQSCQRA